MPSIFVQFGKKSDKTDYAHDTEKKKKLTVIFLRGKANLPEINFYKKISDISKRRPQTTSYMILIFD